MAKITSLGICIMFLVSLFSWPTPVSAGSCVWSAEDIPSRINNILGPAGIDIRDIAIANDAQTIYAVPGDSIADNITYKSTDGGITWTALPVPIRADFIAIAPDDNLLAIANNITPRVYFSINGGVTWQPLGNTVQESPGGAPPSAIYDLAISPDRYDIHYIAVAGKEAGDLANLWYIDLGAALPAWHETKTFTGFATDNETATLAFSPSFATDATVLVVTDNTGITAGVRLQMLNIDGKTWNAAAAFTDAPYTIVNNSGINRLTSASLAFNPEYASNAPSTRKLFIGLTVDGDASANATSGIYRLIDNIQRSILLDIKIHSLVFDGLYLIAGSDNTSTVYQITNPYAVLPASPTITNSAPTKSPGGVDKTVVAWLGNNVVAGTSGDESAFAVSDDYGYTFNDIGLIDTEIAKAKDVAVSNDGKKIYLVSENGYNTSVWCFNTYWRRVFNPRGMTGFIIRILRSSSSYVYLAETGTPNIFYNNASGTAPWLSRTSGINIQDMAVESSQIIYVLNANGVVSKGTSTGLLWLNTNTTNLDSGATIVSVNTSIVLAGSQDGYVAYTLDGGESWTKIPQIVQTGAGKIQVIADSDFIDNNIIYAASDAIGGNIMKWIIGSSTAWTDIVNGVIIGGIYGLAFSDDVLYALEYNAFSGQSSLWRLISPATAQASSSEWTASTTNATTDATDPTVVLNATPQALKASTDKLWAVKTNGTNKLYSYTDTIIDTEISLLSPVDGYRVRVNFRTYLAYDVYFGWDRPSVATGYELVIARDENFDYTVATIPVSTTNDIVYVIVGLDRAGAAYVNFTPGVTFYWRVRVTEPSYGLFSETRHFTVDPSAVSYLQLITLVRGEITSTTNVTLSWLPLQESTEYEVILDDSLPITSPIFDSLTDTSTIKLDITLDYGKTYFWQVRATKPMKSDWSEIGTFNIVERPAETSPVVVKKLPPETTTLSITAPAATKLGLTIKTIFNTPIYVHIIFLIMIILLAVVIVLIYRRQPFRLVFSLPHRKHPPAPPPKITMPSAAPIKPEEKPAPLIETPKTPAPPEKIVPHPTLIEKDKEGAAVIFAAKSFMWMATQQEKTAEGQAGLSEKERHSLGKKLAAKIHDLGKKEILYIKYPEDTPMLLSIWAEYASKNETSNYLTKTFELNPYNAIKLIKCYPPAAQPGQELPSAADFTMAQYDAISEVIDPDNIYAALSKVFKFKAETIEERVPVSPADRNLAFQFMLLHIKTKGEG
ncbi:MAG: hypothetical protein ABR954_05765 [Dehalococcoidales bacterium]